MNLSTTLKMECIYLPLTFKHDLSSVTNQILDHSLMICFSSTFTTFSYTKCMVATPEKLIP